jgi:hypothetical protein
MELKKTRRTTRDMAKAGLAGGQRPETKPIGAQLTFASRHCHCNPLGSRTISADEGLQLLGRLISAGRGALEEKNWRNKALTGEM